MGNLSVKNHEFLALKNLYHLWYNCLSKTPKEELFELYDVHSIAMQLAMISTQFCTKPVRKAESALFSFEGEAGVAVYLETVTKTMLPAGVKGTFIYNVPITADLVRKLQPDIIVHNYELSETINGCAKFRMSLLPQCKEWNTLKELLIGLDKDTFH